MLTGYPNQIWLKLFNPISNGYKYPLCTDIFADQVFSKCYVLRHCIRLWSFADNVRNFGVPATKGEVQSPHPP